MIVDQAVNGSAGPASPSSTFQEIEQDYTYDCFVPIVVSASHLLFIPSDSVPRHLD